MAGHPDPLQQHDHGLSVISLIAFCSLLSSSSLQEFSSSTRQPGECFGGIAQEEEDVRKVGETQQK